MHAAAEYIAPAADQAVLRRLLRGALRVVFRGLVRPPMPIAGQRALFNLLTAISPAQPGVKRSVATLGGRPCEWHRPEQANGCVLLYLHGGAYLIGGPHTHRAICASLAKRGQIEVCALDYRLAPEFPYPAARDDALAAYQALLAAGYSAAQIVIGGDSAGGNLSLITSLRLRDLGQAQPAALVCFSPVTDYTGQQLHSPAAGDPLLNPKWIEQAIGLYCPAHIPRSDPGLSPLFADLTGLAPLLIQVGEDELLLNDSLRFAERAKAAGVSVHLERYPGLWHVFQAHTGLLNAADYALDRVVLFLRGRGC
ncbi:alpha/beta hydrolase [Pseudomonas sp.]|uniref:alpha/beta hydrolase n=1 Tax=Pseudomonas sp. TaxID=306 RepID=UPI00272F2322|nr:alpha/beta hydrolase [Pseudomonas sp.]MDP2243180.1 alpha/beta hydrolase [Pseudomonas sp.]